MRTLAACVVGAGVAVAAVGQVDVHAAGAPDVESVRAVLGRYCETCHNDRLRTAGLALDTMDPARVGDHAAAWEKVVSKLRAGSMPPAGRPRPDEAAYATVAATLETALDQGRRGRAESGPHHPPPPEPAGVRQRDTGPARAGDRRRARCCRPTTPISASTTWRTSSRCPRRCSTGTSSRRAGSAASRWARRTSSRRRTPTSSPPCASRTCG